MIVLLTYFDHYTLHIIIIAYVNNQHRSQKNCKKKKKLPPSQLCIPGHRKNNTTLICFPTNKESIFSNFTIQFKTKLELIIQKTKINLITKNHKKTYKNSLRWP